MISVDRPSAMLTQASAVTSPISAAAMPRAAPQCFTCKHGKTPSQQIILDGEQVTVRKFSI
jgi:hypothetical protein